MYFRINYKKYILKMMMKMTMIHKIQIKKVEYQQQYKVLKIKYMIYYQI